MLICIQCSSSCLLPSLLLIIRNLHGGWLPSVFCVCILFLHKPNIITSQVQSRTSLSYPPGTCDSSVFSRCNRIISLHCKHSVCLIQVVPSVWSVPANAVAACCGCQDLSGLPWSTVNIVQLRYIELLGRLWFKDSFFSILRENSEALSDSNYDLQCAPKITGMHYHTARINSETLSS